MSRMIIHVDMDAFYASVEMRDNPFLYGKPLIIGARPTERGVVATCSYEARKFGVRSGMNIKDACRLCPNGVSVKESVRGSPVKKGAQKQPRKKRDFSG